MCGMQTDPGEAFRTVSKFFLCVFSSAGRFCRLFRVPLPSAARILVTHFQANLNSNLIVIRENQPSHILNSLLGIFDKV
jgi:hypothetical protein